MEKVIKKFELGKEPKSYEYWLTKSPSERLDALELLRKQYYGTEQRLQRVFRIIKLKKD
jgi:hypothetical protein